MADLALERILLTGAAGFIGSHLADRLLRLGHVVLGVDNLSRGSLSNLASAQKHPHFEFVEADLTDLNAYNGIFAGRALTMVWHMVANSDIGAGVADANVDYRDTFLTTFHTLQVMRAHHIPKLAFASTSAVYGVHEAPLREDTGPLFPISNYGAMKLASEAMISAAVESYLERAWIFRFPNVIGPRATHGIIFDLLTKLSKNPPDLEVLGDGSQQKPYLHVSELLDAMLFITDTAKERLNWFNIGPPDEGTTVNQIAETVRSVAAPHLSIRYTGGSRGWVGDVPRFRYSIEKLANLGWRPASTSAQAVERSVVEIHKEFQARCS
ncbi:MAG: NAD-dependent epimerase/dehydratase family protein [Bryobacteraceae bacterium]